MNLTPKFDQRSPGLIVGYVREPDWATENGDIRLWCADCLEILPTLSGVDAVVTDPPYGVGKADWDESFPTSWYSLAMQVCRGTCFIMPGNSALPQCLEMVNGDYQDVFVIWLSNGMTLGPVSFGNWIPVVVAQRERKHLGNQNHLRCVVDASERIEHPSPKPLSAMVKLIAVHTESGVSILDPFMGSGTTGVACIRTGRRFIGIEKEPKYFDIAVKRITDELNRTALFEKPPEIIQRSLLEDRP